MSNEFKGTTSQGSKRKPKKYTIGYGEDIVPDYSLDVQGGDLTKDKGRHYMVHREDFDEGNFKDKKRVKLSRKFRKESGIKNISDLPADYGDRYLMKGRRIVGEASEQDQQLYQDWHKKKFPKKYK